MYFVLSARHGRLPYVNGGWAVDYEVHNDKLRLPDMCSAAMMGTPNEIERCEQTSEFEFNGRNANEKEKWAFSNSTSINFKILGNRLSQLGLL